MMYEATYLHRPNGERPKPRRDLAILILPAVCAVLAAVMIGGISFCASYAYRFRCFSTDLLSSVVYAYYENGLTVRRGEETFQVEGDAVYTIYWCVSQGGMGKESSTTPAQAADGILTFGDGAVLRLWEVTPEAPGEHKLCLSYQGADGDVYTYYTNQFAFEDVWRGYLQASVDG